MTIVLLAVGLLVTAVGFVTIGFGIPINAFSLGNTLIITGAIAVATGLILIGLALVLGQLKRIVEALKSGALPRVTARVAESAEVVSQAAAVRVAPVAVSLPEPVATEPVRTPEPRFPATASEPAAAPAPAPGPLDWLRAKSKPVTIAPPAASPPAPPLAPMPSFIEPPMVEVHDEAPLSPRAPQRSAMPPSAEPVPALEPKAWSPGRDAGPAESRPAPRLEQPMPRATPQVETPQAKERFDLVWPDRVAPGATPASDPRIEPKVEARAEPKVEAKVEPKIEPKVEAKREPALDMPMPPVPARPRDVRPAEKRMPEILRRPAERGPAILKSGVIDGMPYTLYADGSIEAQLPQGMVKFASVDALRSHLEK